jgi:hypothetical protein
MKTIIIKIFKIFGTLLIVLYVVICAVYYFNQENYFFNPSKLTKDYTFDIKEDFEEINFKTEDGLILNSLLFKADSSKGLVIYFHGNGGDISHFTSFASIYTELGYDYFMLDYRGFGKSEGSIVSENQLYEDNQMVYNQLKKSYAEENIIVIGYSMGAAMASQLASNNSPKMLILKAPAYNWDDGVQQAVNRGDSFNLGQILPLSLLSKYDFNNYEFIQNCVMPVTIFHGTSDKVVNHSSSIKLKEHFKSEDRLIIDEGEDHETIVSSDVYKNELKKILGE